LKKKIESITEKYINKNVQDVPRYMSPTIVAKKKMDLTKNKALDSADKPLYDQ